MNDTELLAKYASDRSNEEAFAELVRRRIDLVYSVALRHVEGDSQWAEDVTQGVFTDLARDAVRLSRHPALIGWIYTATRFEASKLMRAENSRKRWERESVSFDLSNEPGDRAWEKLRPVIDEAMQHLSESERATILLRFFQQAPLGAVGRELGISENAAQKKVERTLEKLRRLLGRREITSTSAALGTVLAEKSLVAAPAGLAATVTSAAIAGSSLLPASAAAGALTLMFTAKSTTPVLFGVLAILAAGYAFREHARASYALATIASFNAASARTDNAVSDSSARLRELESEMAKAQSDRSATEAALGKSRAQWVSDPLYLPGVGKVTAGAMASFKQSADQYAELLARLNASPERANRLAIAFSNYGSNSYNARLSALEMGVTPASDPKMYGHFRDAGLADAKEFLHSMVTDSEFEEFLRFDDGDGVVIQRAVNQLWRAKNQMITDKVDMTTEQTEQLRKTLIESAPADKLVNGVPLQYLNSVPVTQQVLDHAATFLSPAQLASLKTASDRYETNQAQNETTARLTRERLQSAMNAGGN